MVVYNKDNPVRGLLSYPVATSLLPGEWRDLQNVRLDERCIAVRPGIYEENDIAAGGTFYGGCIVRANNTGDWLAIAAMHNGSTVVFKYDVFNGTSWASISSWTTVPSTVTSNSFSVPKYGYYDFVAVPNGSGGTSGVFVQNGTDNPIFLNTESVAVNFCCTIQDLDFPRQAGTVAPVMKPSGFVNVRSGGMVSSWPVEDTHYNADGTFDPATAASDEGNIERTGSSPDFVWKLTVGGTGGTSIATVNDYAWFRADSSSDGDFSGGDQILVPLVASDHTWFTCCKWYLTGTTAGDLLIHDPTDFKDSLTFLPSVDGKQIAVFSIADHADETLTDVDGLKLVVCNAALTAAATLEIYGLCCGGRVPSTAQYAVSFYSAQNLSESAGVLLSPEATSLPMIEAGCSVSDEAYFPVDDRVRMAFDVPVFAPPQSEAQKWATYYNVYRRDPGEAVDLFGNGENGDFSYVGQVNVVVYDSDNSNGPSSTSARHETVYATFGNDEVAWSKKADSGTFVDTTRPLDKDFTKRCPGPYTVSMPKGASMTFANGMTYVVGTRGTSAATRNNGVYVSEKDRPARFSAVAGDESDASRGILISLEDENAVKVAAVSASLVGVSTVLAWSDKAIYTVNDTFAVRIADHGCIAPASVASANGFTYWVDQDLVVVEMGSQIRQISRYTVHDQLLAVPASYRKYMSGGINEGRYFLAHASGSSNNNHIVHVFNPDMDAWESRDSVPTANACQFFFKWNTGNGDRMMYYSPTGQIWEYDRPNTADDDGTLIDLAARTRQFNEDTLQMFIGQSTFVCDDQNSRTMTVTRTAIKPDGTSVGTASLDAGGSEAKNYRVDTDATNGNRPGIEGAAIDVKWATSVQHPFRINYLSVEANGQPEKPSS